MLGHRTPSWSFMLLDHEDRPLRLLDGVTGGSGEIVAQARLGGSASLTIDESGQGIDWMRHRVQVIYNPGIAGVDAWATGTYLFSSPTERHTDFGVTYDVDLHTKMVVPDEDTVGQRYSLAAALPIIPAVVALIQSSGESRIAVTPSEKTLTSGLTWDAGTSKLTIINDLLAAAGYWSLWCDGAGQYRIEPYLAPEARPVAHTFAYGQDSLYLPDWDREQDHSAVPNRFVAVGQGDADTDALVAVATNENSASPYSYQARGRWITRTEDGVEAADLTVLEQHAERRLRDAMSPVARLTVGHAMLPLDPNDLIEFIPEDGRRRLATIQRMRFDYDDFTDIDAEWREVIPLG